MAPRAPLLPIDPHRIAPRKIAQAVACLEEGGVVVYPTDTAYGLGCDLLNRKAVDRLYSIRGLKKDHWFSFICNSLSNVTEYALVTDFAYRWLRRMLPGPYTVILPANRTVPKVLVQKRREVGIRVPHHPICQALTAQFGRPILNATASDLESGDPLVDAEVIRDHYGQSVDLVIDGGVLTLELSTVVSLLDDQIEVIRQGKGPIDLFGL